MQPSYEISYQKSSNKKAAHQLYSVILEPQMKHSNWQVWSQGLLDQQEVSELLRHREPWCMTFFQLNFRPAESQSGEVWSL
jgi:hypothetical protein